VGALVKDFFALFSLLKPPPGKNSPRALETSGDSLDLLGEIYGVPRLGQSSVQSDLADRNFEFYVRRGTFGNINGGNSRRRPRRPRTTSTT